MDRINLILLGMMLVLFVQYLRALRRISGLEMLLDGLRRFGHERFEEMIKKGPPPNATV